MFSAIILVAAIGANHQQEPLFPRLFPNPTGQNALEYYVRAADIAREARLNLWSPYLAETRNIPNRLEYEERMAAPTKRILDLVRAGNQFSLVLPEGKNSILAYSGLKVIAKLAQQYSRVQFVRGNPNQGIDTLLLVTEMSDKLYGAGGIIPYLTAIAIDSIAFRGLHSAYTSISLNGAQQILGRLDVLDPHLIADLWQREIAATDSAVRSGEEGYDVDAWAALRPKAQLLTTRLADLFANDEGQWMNLSTDLTRSEQKQLSQVRAVPDAYTAQRLVRTTVVNRTMRRLVRLHAHVAKYRWESGQLPMSLDFLSEEERVDPAAGQPYVYQRFSEAAYDLYSPGDQYWGPIRLRVTRDTMLRGNPGPP